ncbi:adenylyl-sulfate kinase [Paenibacillus polymyxa]|uniref:adenylyl-sulfate kinase n=1 Tax=Paenibacillus polymyxa TaxID=1406 RepID=UPI00307E1FFD
MEPGSVCWITGLSGAGKTTIAQIMFQKIQAQGTAVIWLDGDILREAFGGDLGYSYEDRNQCAFRYAKLCKIFSEQGLIVICSTISMFDNVREWNAHHIKKYFEVYLKVDLDVLKLQNNKQLYDDKDGSVVWEWVEYEEPKNPDMIILNRDSLGREQLADKVLNGFLYKFQINR